MSQSIDEVRAKGEGLPGHKGLGPRARRIAVIEVWEDPDAPETGAQQSKRDETYHRVILSADQKVPKSVTKEEKLAHELGHTIGAIYRLPASAGDPRQDELESRIIKAFGLPEDWLPRMYAAEVEAWDLAEKIVPVKRESREWALNTYRGAK